MEEKRSATNPKNYRSTPSLLEDIIEKIEGDRPPKTMTIGGPRPHGEAVASAVLSREEVLIKAQTYTDRVSVEKLRIIMNTMLNDGVEIDQLKKLAALEISQDSIEAFTYILRKAGLYTGLPSAEDVEAVTAAARAILAHIMTHHGDHFQPQPASITGKTPFMAWRVRESIQEEIIKARNRLSGIDVEIEFATSHAQQHTDQMLDNFPVADIVLWNADIWEAAIRGADAFIGTHIDLELINSVTPMFWQYEYPLGLGPMSSSEVDLKKFQKEKQAFELGGKPYDLVGFEILPVTDTFVSVELGYELVREVRRVDEKNAIITIKPENETQDKVFQKALDGGTHFNKRGILVSLVFIPSRKLWIQFLFPKRNLSKTVRYSRRLGMARYRCHRSRSSTCVVPRLVLRRNEKMRLRVYLARSVSTDAIS